MYESKAITTKISGTSRTAIKLKDNFYTIEVTEERAIPDVEGVDVDAERKLLFEAINSEVDSQIAEIVKTFR